MPFPLSLLANRNPPPPPRVLSPTPNEYDSASSTDSTETAKSHCLSQHTHAHGHASSHLHPSGHRSSFVASSSTSLLPPSGSFAASSEFLLHPTSHHSEPAASSAGRLSVSSTATSTPIPSRSTSPLPQFFTASTPSSSAYTSDADSEPTSPLLARNRKNSRWWYDDSRRWWISNRDSRRRRRRRENCLGTRSITRIVRMILRHPLFPTSPTSILLTLLILTIVAILLTLLLIHVLNPDKEPLPWRAYCSIPSVSTAPPSLGATSFSPTYPFNSLEPSDMSSLSSIIPPPFPPAHLDDFAPAGVLLGVFTMDSAVERRMLVRSTWASHERSRNGAGAGDDGLGTSRTIVRFVLGKPRSSWSQRVQLEAETYNDMIVLPIPENMNSGKTHAFFTWAATEAWVPPLAANSNRNPPPSYSYANMTAPSTIPLAKHDPYNVRQEWHMTGQQAPWVRPDFVVKVDDDSFVMLAELESRLRVELHARTRNVAEGDALHRRTSSAADASETPVVSANPSIVPPPTNSSSVSLAPRARAPVQASTVRPSPSDDPLVYWGYLVKNQFMAGELYALSWSLVDWVARDATVKTMTKGKEDKQVAKWMRSHPRASEVRWKSERCWIYDHPRAGTVYSHGFLFPSEVTRVRKNILSYLSFGSDSLEDEASTSPIVAAPIADDGPTSWSYSSVSTFGTRYNPPLSDLTTLQSVEALVEGSDMSKLKEGGDTTANEAWARREGRRRRYEGKRVGGTVVVHFIKKNPWFLETALAFLESEEVTDREARYQHLAQRAADAVAAISGVFSRKSASQHRRR